MSLIGSRINQSTLKDISLRQSLLKDDAIDEVEPIPEVKRDANNSISVDSSQNHTGVDFLKHIFNTERMHQMPILNGR